MENFKVFGAAVSKQFQAMSKETLYEIPIDKGEIWEQYLASFPEGTNPIHVKKTEHDCNCCLECCKCKGNHCHSSEHSG